jgi:sterol desaturase/sphingolipid hydroxylase (fatty acid hydroxylase superfamily)
MAIAAHHFLPFLRGVILWNPQGLIYLIVLHIGPAEALYYWAHRAFHRDFVFSRYHSLHHVSVTLQPSTARNATFLEHLFLTYIMEIPVIGASWLRERSILLVYLYESRQYGSGAQVQFSLHATT